MKTSVSVSMKLYDTIKKMNMLMKNRSHIQEINRPKYRHRHKYTQYKKHLSKMMMITSIFIKRH